MAWHNSTGRAKYGVGKFLKSNQLCKNKVKKKDKYKEFLPGDLVLKWEARKEDAGKHGKFDHLWFGPFKIAVVEGKNSFSLEIITGEILDAPINGRYLKHFMQ